MKNIRKSVTYCWYALYTRSRAEKKVFSGLGMAGIEAYLPLVKTMRQWSDRRKKVEVPLIRSYVFVRVSEKEYYNVLNVQGVARYVTFEGKAAPIPEWQIMAVKRIIGEALPYELSTHHFPPGERVKITAGALNGLEGEVVRSKGKKELLVRIGQVGYSLIVQLPVSHIHLLEVAKAS